MAYNSSVHATTTFTPFFLNYGIHPRTVSIQTLSSDIPAAETFLQRIQESTKEAIRQITKQNETAARYANRHRLPHSFEIGDKVWLSTKNITLEDGSGSRKLNPKYCGPIKITEKVNDVTVRLDLSQPMIERGIHNAFHVSLLKPFQKDKFDRTEPPAPPIEFDDGHIEYELEKILNHRKRRNQVQYLIKWRGYSDHENSWIPEQNLENSPDLINAYKKNAKLSI